MEHLPEFYMACGQITMFPLLTYRSTQFHFIPLSLINPVNQDGFKKDSIAWH
jgi:hypothetical protein